jgi:hypothetical protein
MPMTRRILALTLVLAVAAGCSDAHDPTVASAGGPGAPSPTPTPTLSFQEQGLRHARCMREHGVPEADPQVDADGNVRIGGGFDKTAVDPDVFGTAMAACQQYKPQLNPQEKAEKLESARQESRCMREHGVENFPDPDPSLDRNVPDSVRDDPQYQEAMEACMRRGGESPAPSR